jgi:hypothetical protein
MFLARGQVILVTRLEPSDWQAMQIALQAAQFGFPYEKKIRGKWSRYSVGETNRFIAGFGLKSSEFIFITWSKAIPLTPPSKGDLALRLFVQNLLTNCFLTEYQIFEIKYQSKLPSPFEGGKGDDKRDLSIFRKEHIWRLSVLFIPSVIQLL